MSGHTHERGKARPTSSSTWAGTEFLTESDVSPYQPALVEGEPILADAGAIADAHDRSVKTRSPKARRPLDRLDSHADSLIV